MTEPSPTQIECLICGTARVVFETTPDATGRCPECGYGGWTYSADLEWTARRTMATRERDRRQARIR